MINASLYVYPQDIHCVGFDENTIKRSISFSVYMYFYVCEIGYVYFGL